MDAANLMRVLLSSKPPPGTLSPDDYEMWSYMHEFPLLWPAIVAVAMFGVIALLNLAVTLKTRTWFMLTIGLTAILECLGYAARIAIIQSWSYGGYVAMMCLLIISPVLLAIVNYIVVGRLMRLANQDALKAVHLNPRWFAVLFTLSDILCLALQGAGAGMLAGSDASSVEMGRKLLLAGLFLQIAFFTMFTLLTIIMHASRTIGLRERRDLLPVFICLYATITLMYIRNIYRCVEFVQGWDGYIATHEVYGYIFDAIVLFIAFIFYTVLHFGWYLPKPDSDAVAGSGPEASGGRTASEEGYPQGVAKASSDAFGLQLAAAAGGARSGSPTSSEATASVRGVHIVSVYPDAAAGSPLAKPQPVAAVAPLPYSVHSSLQATTPEPAAAGHSSRPPSAIHIGSHVGSRNSRVPAVA